MEHKQYIEACKKGDRKAQLHLYKSYYKAMYNTSLRIVNDSYEAEDVMQEAFLTAFTRISEFRGEVSFGAWLKKIVVHKSINALRKQKHFSFVQLDGDIPEEETVTGHQDYRIQEVMGAMQALKSNYRVVLSLYLIEGYDHEEIAQILAVSEGNSRTMVSRAKTVLQKNLTLLKRV